MSYLPWYKGNQRTVEKRMRLSTSHKLVFFDLETTGLDSKKGHRVIEVAAITAEAGEIIDEFQSLVKTERIVPSQAVKIHNITNEMLIDQPAPGEVFPLLKEIFKDRILVAHNAKFDMAFLRKEFSLLGMRLNNRSICTLEMSRKLLPTLPNHKLTTVYQHLTGKPATDIQQHRALDDARMVAAIWRAMEGK